MLKTLLARAALLAGLLACGAGAVAQTTPITLIVGFAPGGTSDGVARLLAQKLPEQLGGRAVIVENKPGAIGILSIRELINTPADRQAYAVLPFSSVIFPVMTGEASGYDIFKDLQSVASLTSYPLGVVVGTATGVRTPKDLLAWLKANPARAQFGTAGTGGHNHFLGLQLGKAIGVEATVVPYKGNAPLLTDLIAGHVPAGVMVAGEVTPHLKDDKLRLVGVLSATRSPLMPDVPTFAEQGIPVGSGEAWYGMWAPARADKAEVTRMQEALGKVLTSVEVREALASRYAMQADYRPADQTAKRLRADFDQWAPVIKASGFKSR